MRPGADAAGFQAFMHFDPARLQFINGSYTPMPFGLPLQAVTATAGGDIDAAAGINQGAGQQPSHADADLVILTFKALVPDT